MRSLRVFPDIRSSQHVHRDVLRRLGRRVRRGLGRSDLTRAEAFTERGLKLLGEQEIEGGTLVTYQRSDDDDRTFGVSIPKGAPAKSEAELAQLADSLSRTNLR